MAWTKFNSDKKLRYVRILEMTGGIRLTARMLDLGYTTIKRHRKLDPTFREQVRLALEKFERNEIELMHEGLRAQEREAKERAAREKSLREHAARQKKAEELAEMERRNREWGK